MGRRTPDGNLDGIRTGRQRILQDIAEYLFQAEVIHGVVEIHPGNTAADIRGCILLGEVRLSDTMIGESQAACKAFEEKIRPGDRR